LIKKLSAKIDGTQMEDDSEIIDAILESRGITDVASFLNPTEDDMVDFDEMIGLHEAYTIIEDAIILGEKFLVLADVDQDGCSANAIMVRYLRARGADVKCVINQGKDHGAEHFDLELLKDIDVMIIVDSIDNNPAVYERILSTGVKLCVFDHHIPSMELLESNLDFVLVSSANYYPNKELSGAGVALKYVLYADYMNLESYADDLGLWLYGALGLVADMVSMESPENRYIVHRGLGCDNNPLIKKTVGSYSFDSTAISFSVAPLTNAAVRVGENDKAMQLFITDDEKEIDDLVFDLKQCKEYQNDVVASLMPALIQQAEEQIDNKCMFFILPTDIDAAVSGLLGNKLLSIYQRPLFVLREKIDIDDETGEINKHEYSGSMRAVGVKSFKEYVDSIGIGWCAGHENAAGAGIPVEEFEEFKIEIEDVLKDVELRVDIEADIELLPSQINENLVKQLAALNRISGTGWAPIKVLVRTDDYEVSTFSSFKHLKIIDNQTGILIVKWNTDEFKTMDNNGTVVAVGTLSNPRYGRNRFLQLTIDDFTKQND
jgi:single-stranded-DNA-specific exonuclease